MGTISTKLHRRSSGRDGFSLVEMLVVVLIIGILISFILPAAQSVREAGRQTQCRNNLRQIGTALTRYGDSHGVLPMGNVDNHGTAWSAFILPQLEHPTIYDKIDLDEGGTGQWAMARPGDPNAGWGNLDACQSVVPEYRCPSAGLPDQLYNISEIDGWVVFRRVPGSYLGCASGEITSQDHPYSGPCAWCSGVMTDLDGMLFNNSQVRLDDAHDGLTQTMLVGEAITDAVPSELNQKEAPGTRDRWYIGGDDPDVNADLSEFLGSTGVPVNDDREIAFGSRHPGGCHVVTCGGDVKFVSEAVDPEQWSRFGNRFDGQNVSMADLSTR